MQSFSADRLRVRDFQILILDDDAAEGPLLGEAILDVRVGCRLHIVFTPEQAIRFLYHEGEFATSPTPHLVFLDYRMPSNGGRVLSILKGDPELRVIPVIALTVAASAEAIRGIYDRHANCCIDKPTIASDLKAEMRNALAFWLDTAIVARNGIVR